MNWPWGERQDAPGHCLREPPAGIDQPGVVLREREKKRLVVRDAQNLGLTLAVLGRLFWTFQALNP